jgi:hypothetical protein
MGTVVPLRTLTPVESLKQRGYTPGTNWGMISQPNGRRLVVPLAVPQLGRAVLTYDDRCLLSSLRLPGDGTQPDRWRAFAHTMMALDPNAKDAATHLSIGNLWVDNLLAQAPGFGNTDDQFDDNTPQQLADGYINRGEAAPLLALLVISMRCGYWQQQTIQIPRSGRYCFEVHHLGIDPTNPIFPDSNGVWDPMVFPHRYQALTWHNNFPVGSDSWAQAREVVMAVDIMSRVAASLVPQLKEFIAAYDAWCVKAQL